MAGFQKSLFGCVTLPTHAISSNARNGRTSSPVETNLITNEPSNLPFLIPVLGPRESGGTPMRIHLGPDFMAGTTGAPLLSRYCGRRRLDTCTYRLLRNFSSLGKSAELRLSQNPFQVRAEPIYLTL
ncbi:hypothetical protein GcC1_175008 [Golovinomyces cichoracearum]|uniref:Uncharacterized protein n=1 Tax=Golovinomyces cichoracearum TaxID=62708 RepID=A0A420HPV8_9PEZI|nr:hypothetical protein GcC1_175008 [Golovinomyces cichoracearum]